MRVCPHCRAALSEVEASCPGCGADLAGLTLRPDDPLVGKIFADTYLIEERIGTGSMSSVYRARQQSAGSDVAIKILSGDDASDSVLARRFQLEARAMSRLRHVNNLTVLDFGQTRDGTFYLVTEMLRGRTLETVIREEAPLDPRRIVRLLSQALAALAEAHAAGIVHRDFKPENIFVEQGRGGIEQVKVFDYGIAKVLGDGADPGLTASGSVCGTPDYMAPEQIRGEPLDERTDVYAAGIVLYEMLTGSRPFTGALVHVLSMHLHHAPEPPQLRRLDLTIPVELERVCLRAMHKDREARLPSATKMQAELLSALAASRSPVLDAARGILLRAAGDGASGQSGHLISFPTTLDAPLGGLPLVGREAALAQLLAQRRHAALVVGPPGSGRSRLVDEWRRRRMERGERVLVMRADPSGARVSWQPVRRVLAMVLGISERPTIDELDTATRDRVADRIGLFDAFGLAPACTDEDRVFRRREALAAAAGLLRDTHAALVCEDVDRYDRPSVEVVQSLMRDPGLARMVVTATAQGDLPLVETVALEPLTLEACRELGLDLDALGLPLEQSALPLAIEQSYRAMLEGAPDASARGRLETLLAPSRRVLAAATVAGNEIETSLLAQATGIGDVQAPLSSLSSRGLVRYEGDRVVLPSPTQRDAFYDALDDEERTGLHRKLAGLFAARDEDPVIVAHHWYAAAPQATPVELLEQAMLSAERAFDDPGAVRWAIRALRRARSDGQSGPGGVVAALGEGADSGRAPGLHGFRADARGGASQAAGGAPDPGRAEGPQAAQTRARIALSLGDALLRLGEIVHAEPAFREVLSSLGADSDSREAALARLGIARVLRAKGKPGQAEAMLIRSLERVGSDGRLAAEISLELASFRASAGRERDAETALIQGSIKAADSPDASWRLLLALAEHSHANGRPEDALRLGRQALAAAENAPPVAFARAHSLLAVVAQGLGDPASAGAHRREAIDALRRVGDRRSVAEMLLGSALIDAVDDIAPRRWLAEAGELARQVGWADGVARAHEALRHLN